MRRKLQAMALDGTLSSADLQNLLPSAEAVWHEPKHLPPRSPPKVGLLLAGHDRRIPPHDVCM